MARATASITITDANRDHGKAFLITEMPASKIESWAFRAILALMASGKELPEGYENLGLAGMAQLGLNALSGLKWEVAEPLLQEIWDCIQYIPDPKNSSVVRGIIDQDVEELTTRIKLRAEVWKLHAGFLKAVASLASKS